MLALTSSGHGNRLYCWDEKTGQCRWAVSTGCVPAGLQDSFDSLIDLSPAADNVAAACCDENGANHVRIWRTANAKELHRVAHPAVLRAVRFVADGCGLLTLCGLGTVQSWHLVRGKGIASMQSHSIVVAAKWASGGEYLATRSVAGEMCIWNVARKECMRRLSAYTHFDFFLKNFLLLYDDSTLSAAVFLLHRQTAVTLPHTTSIAQGVDGAFYLLYGEGELPRRMRILDIPWLPFGLYTEGDDAKLRSDLCSQLADDEVIRACPSLIAAAMLGDADSVRALLDTRPHLAHQEYTHLIGERSINLPSALHYAIIFGHADCVAALRLCGAHFMDEGGQGRLDLTRAGGLVYTLRDLNWSPCLEFEHMLASDMFASQLLQIVYRDMRAGYSRTELEVCAQELQHCRERRARCGGVQFPPEVDESLVVAALHTLVPVLDGESEFQEAFGRCIGYEQHDILSIVEPSAFDSRLERLTDCQRLVDCTLVRREIEVIQQQQQLVDTALRQLHAGEAARCG